MLTLGQAKGALIGGFMSGNTPVFEYTALPLKQAVADWLTKVLVPIARNIKLPHK